MLPCDIKQIKQPAARFEKGEWMNTVTTSYKHNGVPVSIPRGSYGVTRLTARLYEYPKGHPCRGCPFTLRTSVPSCMFPSRKDGGCLWYDLKRKKRPPLPHTYPQNQAAVERIFDFIEVLKTDFYRLFFEQLARKGFDVKRSQSSDYIADIYYKNQLVAYFSKADTVIQNPFIAV